MNKKIRDRFFGVFVVLFVVITTILSLIATGYRFNLSWPLNFGHLLQKTGTIALDSAPKGAKITLSGEQKKGLTLSSLFGKDKEQTTPVKVKNLLPGEYTVSFELDGYWPYEKKVRVNNSQTTFLENVILFKKSLALNIIQTSPQELNYSINNRYAWLEKDKSIIDLKTEEVIYHASSAKINWANNEKQIIDSSAIVNLENGQVNDYQAAIGTPQEAQFQNNKIVYLNKNNLTIYNTTDKTSKAVANNGQIISYKAGIKNILTIIKRDGKIKLESYSIENGQLLGSTDLLLEANKYTISEEDNNNILITDKEHQLLYIANANEKLSIITILKKVSAYKWKGNGQIIYASGPEIYTYDIAQDKSWLINRLSEDINSLTWSNTNNYLIYASNNNIGIINLNDGRNDTTTIWTADKLSYLNLDDKNQILYFYGAIGQQMGLYKMSLR